MAEEKKEGLKSNALIDVLMGRHPIFKKEAQPPIPEFVQQTADITSNFLEQLPPGADLPFGGVGMLKTAAKTGGLAKKLRGVGGKGVVDIGGPKAKPFAEQAFKHSQPVKVTVSGLGKHAPAETFIDEVKGLNKGHALWRAKQNWPDAIVEVIEGGK